MLNRAYLLGTLLLASGSSLATPSIELPEAMRMAEAYISDQGIPNTERYLASVVRVCSDGSIHHQAGAWG